MNDLSDAQWCLLDLLVRAKDKGVTRVNRHELMASPSLPAAAKVKLVFGGLTMPGDLVVMNGAGDFELTELGEQTWRLRFGQNVKPTTMADVIIALPDQSGGRT